MAITSEMFCQLISSIRSQEKSWLNDQFEGIVFMIILEIEVTICLFSGANMSGLEGLELETAA